ncbi:hypothetical protein LAUMK41_00262 [Mycobacterium attenuatum]|nr:hypothetical protein LAUMK41_00262 [Mycobacterium attenuatum]
MNPTYNWKAQADTDLNTPTTTPHVTTATSPADHASLFLNQLVQDNLINAARIAADAGWPRSPARWNLAPLTKPPCLGSVTDCVTAQKLAREMAKHTMR